jgi:hypothetical protein
VYLLGTHNETPFNAVIVAYGTELVSSGRKAEAEQADYSLFILLYALYAAARWSEDL